MASGMETSQKKRHKDSRSRKTSVKTDVSRQNSTGDRKQRERKREKGIKEVCF